MAPERDIELNDMQLDTLKEIGNLGSAKATDILAKLISKSIVLKTPDIKIIAVSEIENLIGGPRELITCTTMKIEGDIRGGVMILFRRNAAMYLVDLMKKSKEGITRVLEEMDVEAFIEMSNIINNAYLTPLADFFNLKFMPSTPQVVLDIAGLLEDIVGNISSEIKYALIIGTDFNLEGEEMVEGKFLMLLEQESLNKLLKLMDEKIGKMPSRIF